MSVLKSHRSESKAEYVSIANQICNDTIEFLSRLSARYSRLLAPKTAGLAADVLIYAESANNTYPSDKVKAEKREEYLVSAAASLHSLDDMLAHCYEIMMKNPEGCFVGSDGKRTVSSSEATRKLENMSQELGELIDKEGNKLAGVMKSDKERAKAARQSARKKEVEQEQEETAQEEPTQENSVERT